MIGFELDIPPFPLIPPVVGERERMSLTGYAFENVKELHSSSMTD